MQSLNVAERKLVNMKSTSAAATHLPHDLGTPLNPGAVTPTRNTNEKQSMEHKRKQTLLTLLDALTELKNDDDLGRSGVVGQTNKERELDGPAIDEHLQVVGAEVFSKFLRRVSDLDRELRNFANATRQLGSSVGILSSAYHLRERLAQILFLFRENAADLFPRKVLRQPREHLLSPNDVKSKRRRERATSHALRPVLVDVLDPEDFPRQMEMFANDIQSFLKSLNEFPEFGDEAVDKSICSFEGDLRYWASCLKTYEGQFRYPAVQRYLHDLTAEMGEHLDNITSSLSMFLEIGIPTIRFAQKHAANNLLNLTTIATFFSAVTATTLQLSVTDVGTPLADAVNGFWFFSLVFSIASAVNSLLGLTWKQAIYRSPGDRVPWWVLIWIKRSPLIFLVVSVAAFSVGLCLFAYSSGQHRITSALTTVFTVCCSFGLMAVSAWFAFERWTFNRHRGKKWLMDVLHELQRELYAIPPIRWLEDNPPRYFKYLVKWFFAQMKRAKACFSHISTRLIRTATTASSSDIEKGDTVEQYTLPVHGNESGIQSPLSGPTSPMNSPTAPVPPSILASRSSTSLSPSDATNMSESTLPADGSVPRTRFATVVRSVMMKHRALGIAGAASPLSNSPRRQRTLSSSLDTAQSSRREPEPLSTMRASRVAALKRNLKSLEPMHDLTPHQALVRHLQFSPDGKYLATCSWDQTCVIFNVHAQFSIHRVLAHPKGFIGQVAWSSNGTQLLTKMSRNIKVWSTDSGVCKKTIIRQQNVVSIAWFPGGDAFLSVEDGCIVKLDLNGRVLDTYTFDNMKLHDVAVTPNSQRILCVATLLQSADGLQPSKSRAEKQIIVYNLEKKDIENQVPVLHDVRDITLARNGMVALVSYENKAPPQLWQIQMVKDMNDENSFNARLSLSHTYMPKSPVDFAGPSYFGGNSDQLVLCAGKGGDIHIWDRESSALLHSFRAQDMDGDLTCIAWNHAAMPFMFATGSHDGALRIWTTPPAPDPSSTSMATPNPYRDNSAIFRLNGSSNASSPRPSRPSSFVNEGIERTDSPTPEDFDSADGHTPRRSLDVLDAVGPSSLRVARIKITPPDTA